MNIISKTQLSTDPLNLTQRVSTIFQIHNPAPFSKPAPTELFTAVAPVKEASPIAAIIPATAPSEPPKRASRWAHLSEAVNQQEENDMLEAQKPKGKVGVGNQLTNSK